MEAAPRRCRQAKKLSRLTVQEIAERSGLSISAINRLLDLPDRRPSHYAAFAAAVGSQPSYLAFGELSGHQPTEDLIQSRVQIELDRYKEKLIDHIKKDSHPPPKS